MTLMNSLEAKHIEDQVSIVGTRGDITQEIVRLTVEDAVEFAQAILDAAGKCQTP